MQNSIGIHVLIVLASLIAHVRTLAWTHSSRQLAIPPQTHTVTHTLGKSARGLARKL